MDSNVIAAIIITIGCLTVSATLIHCMYRLEDWRHDRALKKAFTAPWIPPLPSESEIDQWK